MSKAILILDYIDEEDIEELRADVILDLYGNTYGFYKNMTLKPMPQKKVPVFIPNDCDMEKEIKIINEIEGYNACIDEIIGEEE